MAVIESTLMECEFLPTPKKGHTLFCSCMVPKEMFEILYFMGKDPLHHNVKYGILLLCSHPVSYMQFYMCLGSPHYGCSFLNLLVFLSISFSHCWIMSISPCYGPYGDSTQNGLHSFCIQLDATWLRASAMTLSLPF